MKKWQIQQPDLTAAKKIQAGSDLSLFCAELLTVRGYRTVEEAALQFSCNAFSDPFLIRDMQAAADCLNAAVDSGEKICIYGDYDCDGIIATVILYSYLSELGADVMYYIPEREEGYGMNQNALETLKAQGVSLIVTVDNGIAALEEANWLAEQGIRLVVTDHHQPYDALPAAEAVVDPHRPDCPAPFSLFCGAGLALKLVAAMDGGDMTIALEQFGDLAAIATVADVVSLTGENRLLVQQGLRLLANTERPGLLALLELSGMQNKPMTATNLAFSIAPRINAAGRFGSPKLAVSLLLAETMEEAMPLAKQLEQCNRQRKAAEQEILQEIQAQIQANPSSVQQRVLLFSGKNWHHGVIGIVAARLQEQFGKPAMLVTIEGDMARGSARSFGDFSIFACLDACRAYLTKYGGHPGAGGFSLQTEQIDCFFAAVQQYATETFPTMPQMTLQADRLLMPQDLTIENMASLSVLEPYGEGNPAPVFAICHAVLQAVQPLSNGLHSKLKLRYGSLYLDVLLFRVAPEDVGLPLQGLCDVLVTAECKTFQGRPQLSLIAKDYRRSGISQAKYFAAKDAYEKLCRKEPLPSAYYTAMTPTRAELVAVYKRLPEMPISMDTLFVQMQQQLNYGKLRLILDIFAELQLIKIDSWSETVQRLPVQGTVPLEQSMILAEMQEKTGRVFHE